MDAELLDLLKRSAEQIKHTTRYAYQPQIFDTDDASERALAREMASRCTSDCLKCRLEKAIDNQGGVPC